MTNDELVKILTPFCSTDVTRPNLIPPFNQTIGGKDYATGTDGRIACIVEGRLDNNGDSGAPRCDPKAVRSMWLDAVNPSLCPVTVSMAAFREWVATFPPPPVVLPPNPGVECDECDGEGTVECECDCGDLHEKDCKHCDGKGTFGGTKAEDEPMFVVKIKAPIIGSFFGDGRIIRLIATMGGDSFRLGYEDKNTRLIAQGEGWAITAMALHGPEAESFTFNVGK